MHADKLNGSWGPLFFNSVCGKAVSGSFETEAPSVLDLFALKLIQAGWRRRNVHAGLLRQGKSLVQHNVKPSRLKPIMEPTASMPVHLRLSNFEQTALEEIRSLLESLKYNISLRGDRKR